MTPAVVEPVVVACPRCGAEQEDMDGFGVLACDACGLCEHPSRDGDGTGGMVCSICGDVERDEPVAVGMEVEVVTCYGSCADHEGQRGQVAHVYPDLVDVLLDGVWWRGCLATQVRRVEDKS